MTELFKDTKFYADQLSYYKDAALFGYNDKVVIEKAADDYVKAKAENNESLKNKAMAVLMLKFWYQMQNMYNQCKAVTLMEYNDYYDKLYSCIDTACFYHAWQDPEKNTNAQACINATISSRGAAEVLYQSNLAKTKANINKASLDHVINGSDTDDNKVTVGDTMADDQPKISMAGSKAARIVQDFINQGKVEDAIILDNIAFGDSVKTTSENATYEMEVKNKDGTYSTQTVKYKKNSVEFWAFRLMRLLNDTNSDYIQQFVDHYNANLPEVEAAVAVINTTANSILYKHVGSCLADLKKMYLATPEILEHN